MRRRSAQNAGFTLVELLVASTVTIFAIALVLSVFSRQQGSMRGLDLLRGNEEAARDALVELEPALRRAGYGIEPRYAFDFGTYRCATPGQCRDRADAPDELVFVSRDPNYRWTAAGGGLGRIYTLASRAPGSFTLMEGTAGTGPAVLHKGRVLLAVCADGSDLAMQTVSQTTAMDRTGGSTTVQLAATDAADPYRDPRIASVGCFQSGSAFVFLVDRHRYAVQTFGGVPYLVLDTGLDLNGDGQTPAEGDDDDLLPIAAGVEDLQVAYLLDESASFVAPDQDANWVVGDTSGVREEPNPAAAAPDYRTSNVDARRFNLHPANIRAVRLSLGLRSALTDGAQPPAWTGDPLRLIENRSTQLASLGRFRRSTVRSTVTLRNLESRSPFIF